MRFVVVVEEGRILYIVLDRQIGLPDCVRWWESFRCAHGADARPLRCSVAAGCLRARDRADRVFRGRANYGGIRIQGLKQDGPRSIPIRSSPAIRKHYL